MNAPSVIPPRYATVSILATYTISKWVSVVMSSSVRRLSTWHSNTIGRWRSMPSSGTPPTIWRQKSIDALPTMAPRDATLPYVRTWPRGWQTPSRSRHARNNTWRAVRSGVLKRASGIPTPFSSAADFRCSVCPSIGVTQHRFCSIVILLLCIIRLTPSSPSRTGWGFGWSPP